MQARQTTTARVRRLHELKSLPLLPLPPSHLLCPPHDALACPLPWCVLLKTLQRSMGGRDGHKPENKCVASLCEAEVSLKAHSTQARRGRCARYRGGERVACGGRGQALPAWSAQPRVRLDASQNAAGRALSTSTIFITVVCRQSRLFALSFYCCRVADGRAVYIRATPS